MKTILPNSIKRRPLLFTNVAWAVVFATTTAAVWQMNSSSTSDDGLNESQRRALAGEPFVPRLAGAPNAEGSDGDSAKDVLRANGLPNQVSGGEMQSLMNSALSASDPLERANQVSALLMKLSADNIEEALAALEEGPRSGLDNELFESFMAKWGQIDGQAALEYALNDESERRIRGGDDIAINSWASTNPNAAISYLGDIEDGDNKERMHHSVFEALLEQDLDWATEFAMQNSPGRARGASIRDLADAHFEQGGADGLREWIDSIEAGEENGMTGYKSAAIERAAQEMAESDPAAAVELVENHVGTDLLREDTYRSVARALSEENPQQGMDWLSSLPENGQRNEAIAEEIEDWADDNPNDAGGWLSSQLAQGSNEALDPVVSSFAREIVSEDPQSAIAWGSIIENERIRNGTLSRIGREWIRRDRDQALAWLQSGNAPENVQRQLARYFR